ncbi:hypothetical protein ABZ297_06515 [Nonomuraea sp. NPDC005983]|uniref:hypothetical protein n=1 Tax=Nonomuraea sp. NPDC005983 TaxID=3155595 RepID=UPI0033B3B092
MSARIGVGMVGYAFMGRVHSQAWRNVAAFDFESMNEPWFCEGTGGFRRILVTEPDHPYAGAWWPPGHGLGYEHAFTHEVKDFLEAIAAGTAPEPSFDDGLRVQRVLGAVEDSAAHGSRLTLTEDA